MSKITKTLLNIKRELAFANSEEETNNILQGGNKITQVEDHMVEKPASKTVKCGSIKCDSKPIVEHPLIKKELPRLYDNAAPFMP